MKRKIGFVLLKGEGARWIAQWTNPATGKYLRRVLPAGNYKDAVAMATEINRDLAAGQGWAPRLRGGEKSHSVAEAALEAISHSDANEATRRDYVCRANGFLDWLAANRPAMARWADVTEAVCADYREAIKGLAPDTIRLRLYVLRMVSAYMAKTYPGACRDVAAGVRPPKRKDAPPVGRLLAPAQVRALLDWLEAREPLVYVWACLEGLAGLRMTEAAYLRRGDLAPDGRAVCIADTAAHAVKTPTSRRVVPLCGRAAAALAGWIDRWPYKREHPEGYLFLPRKRRGNVRSKLVEARAGALCQDSVRKLWCDAMRAARAELALPAGFTPRRLRNSFITALREAGADFADLQAYVGHAPSTVMSAHYDEPSLARLRRIADLAGQVFDAGVTARQPASAVLQRAIAPAGDTRQPRPASEAVAGLYFVRAVRRAAPDLVDCLAAAPYTV